MRRRRGKRIVKTTHSEFVVDLFLHILLSGPGSLGGGWKGDGISVRERKPVYRNKLPVHSVHLCGKGSKPALIANLIRVTRHPDPLESVNNCVDIHPGADGREHYVIALVYFMAFQLPPHHQVKKRWYRCHRTVS